MFQSYNFDQQEVDMQQYYFFKEGFTKEELNKISQGVAKLPFKKSINCWG